MVLKELSLVLLLAIAVLSVAPKDRNKKPYKVVCYLGSWANYRQGDAKFLIENIDPFLCTHLVYGFAKLTGNQIAVYDPYLDLKENWGLGAFQRFNGLKKQNPELSTIIAIGGWNEGSTKYSQMASNAASRAEFVKSVIDFCKKYDFDGLDMDWEYPANRGGAASDKETFILLLKELKAAMEPEGLLLTAAVAAGKATMDSAYNIRAMGEHLDIINVMAYDLHGSWEKFAGHNAPLYARDSEKDLQRTLNVDYAMNYWIDNGAPLSKLVLGMGTYGRSFTLENANNNDIDATTTGPGAAGPMTREPGMLGYNEICLNVKNGGWKSVFVDKIEAPYATKDRQWVGYDDIKSIKIKVDYLKKKKLGGGMIWSLETDDFRGKCGDGNYPLLTVINQDLNGPVTRQTVDPNQPTEATKATEATPPTEPRPTAPTSDYQCTKEGMFRDPTNCQAFHQCVPAGSGFTRHTFSCGEDQAFDEGAKVCNHRHLIPECNN